MRISPRFVVADWTELTFESEPDWRKAVDIFSERVHERYLDPIASIEKCDYSGFAILALDCLLIEMLQQFREGVYRTPKGRSKLYFINFLTQSAFGEHFDKKMAEMFYTQIRCGILHQAEIRGNSKIWVSDQIPLVGFSDDRSGLIVNRRSFHRQLLREFENYKTGLLDPDNVTMRRRFRKKMMHICKNACEVI